MLLRTQAYAFNANGDTHAGLFEDISTRSLQTVRVGEAAGKIATGIGNAYIGYETGRNAQGGSYLTGVGYQALMNAQQSMMGTAIGAYCAAMNNRGSEFVYIGFRAGELGSDSSQTVGVGAFALREAVSTLASVAVGYRAMERGLDGSYNTAVGALSMQNIRSGQFSTAAGYASGRGAQGSYNTLFGAYAGYCNVGDANCIFGFAAGQYLTTGDLNCVFGPYAMEYARSSYCNIAIGPYAASTATGDNTVTIGYAAGQSNVSQSSSVILGSGAGSAASSITRSVYVGAAVASNVSGTNSVFIGYAAGIPAPGSVGAAAGAVTAQQVILIGDARPIGSNISHSVAVASRDVQLTSENLVMGESIISRRAGSIISGFSISSDAQNSILLGSNIAIESVTVFKDPLNQGYVNSVLQDGIFKFSISNILYTDTLYARPFPPVTTTCNIYPNAIFGLYTENLSNATTQTTNPVPDAFALCNFSFGGLSGPALLASVGNSLPGFLGALGQNPLLASGIAIWVAGSNTAAPPVPVTNTLVYLDGLATQPQAAAYNTAAAQLTAPLAPAPATGLVPQALPASNLAGVRFGTYLDRHTLPLDLLALPGGPGPGPSNPPLTINFLSYLPTVSGTTSNARVPLEVPVIKTVSAPLASNVPATVALPALPFEVYQRALPLPQPFAGPLAPSPPPAVLATRFPGLDPALLTTVACNLVVTRPPRYGTLTPLLFPNGNLAPATYAPFPETPTSQTGDDFELTPIYTITDLAGSNHGLPGPAVEVALTFTHSPTTLPGSTTPAATLLPANLLVLSASAPAPQAVLDTTLVQLVPGPPGTAGVPAASNIPLRFTGLDSNFLLATTRGGVTTTYTSNQLATMFANDLDSYSDALLASNLGVLTGLTTASLACNLRYTSNTLGAPLRLLAADLFSQTLNQFPVAPLSNLFVLGTSTLSLANTPALAYTASNPSPTPTSGYATSSNIRGLFNDANAWVAAYDPAGACNITLSLATYLDAYSNLLYPTGLYAWNRSITRFASNIGAEPASYSNYTTLLATSNTYAATLPVELLPGQEAATNFYSNVHEKYYGQALRAFWSLQDLYDRTTRIILDPSLPPGTGPVARAPTPLPPDPNALEPLGLYLASYATAGTLRVPFLLGVEPVSTTLLSPYWAGRASLPLLPYGYAGPSNLPLPAPWPGATGAPGSPYPASNIYLATQAFSGLLDPATQTYTLADPWVASDRASVVLYDSNQGTRTLALNLDRATSAPYVSALQPYLAPSACQVVDAVILGLSGAPVITSNLLCNVSLTIDASGGGAPTSNYDFLYAVPSGIYYVATSNITLAGTNLVSFAYVGPALGSETFSNYFAYSNQAYDPLSDTWTDTPLTSYTLRDVTVLSNTTPYASVYDRFRDVLVRTSNILTYNSTVSNLSYVTTTTSNLSIFEDHRFFYVTSNTALLPPAQRFFITEFALNTGPATTLTTSNFLLTSNLSLYAAIYPITRDLVYGSPTATFTPYIPPAAAPYADLLRPGAPGPLASVTLAQSNLIAADTYLRFFRTPLGPPPGSPLLAAAASNLPTTLTLYLAATPAGPAGPLGPPTTIQLYGSNTADAPPTTYLSAATPALTTYSGLAAPLDQVVTNPAADLAQQGLSWSPTHLVMASARRTTLVSTATGLISAKVPVADFAIHTYLPRPRNDSNQLVYFYTNDTTGEASGLFSLPVLPTRNPASPLATDINIGLSAVPNLLASNQVYAARAGVAPSGLTYTNLAISPGGIFALNPAVGSFTQADIDAGLIAVTVPGVTRALPGDQVTAQLTYTLTYIDPTTLNPVTDNTGPAINLRAYEHYELPAPNSAVATGAALRIQALGDAPKATLPDPPLASLLAAYNVQGTPVPPTDLVLVLDGPLARGLLFASNASNLATGAPQPLVPPQSYTAASARAWHLGADSLDYIPFRPASASGSLGDALSNETVPVRLLYRGSNLSPPFPLTLRNYISRFTPALCDTTRTAVAGRAVTAPRLSAGLVTDGYGWCNATPSGAVPYIAGGIPATVSMPFYIPGLMPPSPSPSPTYWVLTNTPASYAPTITPGACNLVLPTILQGQALPLPLGTAPFNPFVPSASNAAPLLATAADVRFYVVQPPTDGVLVALGRLGTAGRGLASFRLTELLSNEVVYQNAGLRGAPGAGGYPFTETIRLQVATTPYDALLTPLTLQIPVVARPSLTNRIGYAYAATAEVASNASYPLSNLVALGAPLPPTGLGVYGHVLSSNLLDVYDTRTGRAVRNFLLSDVAAGVIVYRPQVAYVTAALAAAASNTPIPPPPRMTMNLLYDTLPATYPFLLTAPPGPTPSYQNTPLYEALYVSRAQSVLNYLPDDNQLAQDLATSNQEISYILDARSPITSNLLDKIVYVYYEVQPGSPSFPVTALEPIPRQVIDPYLQYCYTFQVATGSRSLLDGTFTRTIFYLGSGLLVPPLRATGTPSLISLADHLSSNVPYIPVLIQNPLPFDQWSSAILINNDPFNRGSLSIYYPYDPLRTLDAQQANNLLSEPYFLTSATLLSNQSTPTALAYRPLYDRMASAGLLTPGAGVLTQLGLFASSTTTDNTSITWKANIARTLATDATTSPFYPSFNYLGPDFTSNVYPAASNTPSGPILPAGALPVLLDTQHTTTRVQMRNVEIFTSTYTAADYGTADVSDPNTNILVGKDISIRGLNNVCIGNKFSVSGNNSIVVGNIGASNLGAISLNDIYQSILVGYNLFNNSYVRNILAIGTNIMNNLLLVPEVERVTNFLNNNPVLFGNDITTDYLDYYINFANVLLKTATPFPQLYLGLLREPVYIGYSSNVNSGSSATSASAILNVQGNTVIRGNLTVTSNLTAGQFTGGIVSASNLTTSNLVVLSTIRTSNLTAFGALTASNASLRTSLDVGTSLTTSNLVAFGTLAASNATFLTSLDVGTILTTSNITALATLTASNATFLTSLVAETILTTSNITALGTLTASNATFLTSLVAGSNVTARGAATWAYGGIDIPHPAVQCNVALSNTRLLHSAVAAPRNDLLYRGVVTLSAGAADVNLDQDCVEAPAESRLPETTFETLVRNPSIFLQNQDSFDRVRGSIVASNILNIVCENGASTDRVAWMVVGERKDPTIYGWPGRVTTGGYLVPQYEGGA